MFGIGCQFVLYWILLIGINYGWFGFIIDIVVFDMQVFVFVMLVGKFECEECLLFEVWIVCDGELIYYVFVFNDVVVNCSGFFGMVELCVLVDGCYMYNQCLDGLIVVMFIGLIVYVLLLVGLIFYLQLVGIVFVLIVLYVLLNWLIVLFDDLKIVIQIVGGCDVNVNFDMQLFMLFELNDMIEVCCLKYMVLFLYLIGYSYYMMLCKKLYWNEYVLNEDDKVF